MHLYYQKLCVGWYFVQMLWECTVALFLLLYLWIGCQEGRLLIYNTITEKAQLYIPKAFQRSTIRHIVSDNKGALWIGLQNGKVFKCDNPSGIEHVHPDSIYGYHQAIFYHRNAFWKYIP